MIVHYFKTFDDVCYTCVWRQCISGQALVAAGWIWVLRETRKRKQNKSTFTKGRWGGKRKKSLGKGVYRRETWLTKLRKWLLDEAIQCVPTMSKFNTRCKRDMPVANRHAHVISFHIWSTPHFRPRIHVILSVHYKTRLFLFIHI